MEPILIGKKAFVENGMIIYIIQYPLTIPRSCTKFHLGKFRNSLNPVWIQL